MMRGPGQASASEQSPMLRGPGIPGSGPGVGFGGASSQGAGLANQISLDDSDADDLENSLDDSVLIAKDDYTRVAAGSPAIKQNAVSIVSVIFFAAACAIMISAFLGSFWLYLTSGSFIDLLNLTYIFIFGSVLAILDTPLFRTMKFVEDYKTWMRKYVSVITRVTGKGVLLVFLGCAVIAAIVAKSTSILLFILVFPLNIFVILVGLFALVIGIFKSRKLKIAQQHLAGGGQVLLENQCTKYAIQYPGEKGGLTMQEFNKLVTANTPGAVAWDEADLKLVFNAIVTTATFTPAQLTDPTPRVSKTDLLAWANGGMVFL